MRIIVFAAVLALASCATRDPNEALTIPMISSVLTEVQAEFNKPLALE
jgi:hypothetical protein